MCSSSWSPNCMGHLRGGAIVFETEVWKANPVTLVCPSNPAHGVMLPRSKQHQTPEQLFCGEWYDCQHCKSSILDKSPELEAFLAQFRRFTPEEVAAMNKPRKRVRVKRASDAALIAKAAFAKVKGS